MLNGAEDVIRDINKIGHSGAGRTAYLKYLKGGNISRPDACKSYCYQCQGFCADPNASCDLILCPLWPWSPYKVDPVDSMDADI